MALFRNDKRDDTATLRNLPEGYDDESSPFYVPAELRADYDACPAITHKQRHTWMEHVVRLRADAEQSRANREYAEQHDGRTPFPPLTDTHNGVIARGVQDGDDLVAEHLFRRKYASKRNDERTQAADTERRRQDAKCHGCGALDVPTREVVVTTPDRRLNLGASGRGAEDLGRVVAKLPGRFCAPCETVARHRYAETLAATVLEDGTTRGDTIDGLIRTAG